MKKSSYSGFRALGLVIFKVGYHKKETMVFTIDIC